jgi:hypothetical protein
MLTSNGLASIVVLILVKTKNKKIKNSKYNPHNLKTIILINLTE